MTWPTVAVDTTDTDAGTDVPANARADILDSLQKLNQMIAHVSAYAATVMDDADAAAARATLALGTIATQAASAVSITGGSVTGITDLAIADGGTGASTAAAARTALGSTTVGNAVFIAATASAARDAIEMQKITLATAIGAGGTSMDWTGIPSGVKHITIMGVGISSNGVAGFICQIGDSGGLETAGYASYVTNALDGASSVSLTAFHLTNATSPGSQYQFKIFLALEHASTNTWVSSSFVVTGNVSFIGVGSKALSGTLDRVRFNAGGDTIDLGAVNISYEGHP